MEQREKLDALALAACALNKAGITWAVGASALLFLENVTDSFNDLDLLIGSGEADFAKTVLLAAGAVSVRAAAPSDVYATEHFLELELNHVDIDLLCNFAVRRRDEVYRYPLDAGHIARVADVQGVPVPLCPIADWYVLYLLMPGRGRKATLVDRYLREHPTAESRARLSRWLSSRLPGEVREPVMNLYNALR